MGEVCPACSLISISPAHRASSEHPMVCAVQQCAFAALHINAQLKVRTLPIQKCKAIPYSVVPTILRGPKSDSRCPNEVSARLMYSLNFLPYGITSPSITSEVTINLLSQSVISPVWQNEKTGNQRLLNCVSYILNIGSRHIWLNITIYGD